MELAGASSAARPGDLIADSIRPGGLLLCNESFASTNERGRLAS